MPNLSTPHCLVIGYGNEIRGDDGLGPYLARALAERTWPGVRVVAVPQLLPELAAELATVDRAVFLDAAADPGAEPVALARVHPAASGGSLSHAATPAGLLALTEAVYGRVPEAWLVTVAGRDFGLGMGLSPEATAHARRALVRVEQLLAAWRDGPDSGGRP